MADLKILFSREWSGGARYNAPAPLVQFLVENGVNQLRLICAIYFFEDLCSRLARNSEAFFVLRKWASSVELYAPTVDMAEIKMSYLLDLNKFCRKNFRFKFSNKPVYGFMSVTEPNENGKLLLLLLQFWLG